MLYSDVGPNSILECCVLTGCLFSFCVYRYGPPHDINLKFGSTRPLLHSYSLEFWHPRASLKKGADAPNSGHSTLESSFSSSFACSRYPSNEEFGLMSLTADVPEDIISVVEIFIFPGFRENSAKYLARV